MYQMWLTAHPCRKAGVPLVIIITHACTTVAGLRFKFDIGRLLDPRFDYCNLVWNNNLSNVSAELLANVSVLKDFLLFRDKPEVCSDMFNTDDITCFITALRTG